MSYIVRYIVNGRWVLGGNFTSKARCGAFCAWLAADGIQFEVGTLMETTTPVSKP